MEPVGASQLRATWCGLPVPLKLTTAVELVDELLVMVNCPVAAPVAVGSNVSEIFIVWRGSSVAGRLTGESEKPLPETFTALTVTAAVPVDVRVTV